MILSTILSGQDRSNLKYYYALRFFVYEKNLVERYTRIIIRVQNKS